MPASEGARGYVELRSAGRSPPDDAARPPDDDRGVRSTERIVMSVLHVLSGAPVAAAIGGYQLGTGRLVPSVAAVLALAGAVVAVRALARSRRPGADDPGWAVGAVAASQVGAAVGGVHAANAARGLGTGNRLAGGVVAVAVGAVGTVAAALVLARSRRRRVQASAGPR
jgi:hypothetical protein